MNRADEHTDEIPAPQHSEYIKDWSVIDTAAQMSLLSEECPKSVENEIYFETVKLNCVLKDPKNGNIEHEKFIQITNYHLGWNQMPDSQPQVHKNLIAGVISNLQHNILPWIRVL